MKRWLIILFVLLIASSVVIEACRVAEPLPPAELNDILSGGSQTVFDQSGAAFSQPFPYMSAQAATMHTIGDLAFEATFVPAPAPVNPGLGPLYNSNACSSCHISDGRGKPPGPGEELVSLLIRMSIPGEDPTGGPNPVPGFGGQLQQRAIFGVQPEANVSITYSEQTGTFDDGTTYQLQIPTYTLTSPYRPLPAGVMISPRVAPPVLGLGLLESIPEDEILSHADENDANGDGIRGTPNYVWDVQQQKLVLGRFGWKAGQPSVVQQAAGAFNQDMGITNRLFPVESCHGQPQESAAATLYNQCEIADSLLAAVAFYMQTLAVPARRNTQDPMVIRGKTLFTDAGCTSCHIPMATTGVNVAAPELSNQTIFPYTDLLLHDMGPELADNRPEFRANGRQWRTPPLWGIGLTQLVNGHTNFLHDGRARSLLEAIMWHGGEATAARDYVSKLSASDRQALIAFLNSL
jgi:CxxC motif-containing protein (DUF1111 family)